MGILPIKYTSPKMYNAPLRFPKKDYIIFWQFFKFWPPKRSVLAMGQNGLISATWGQKSQFCVKLAGGNDTEKF